MTKTNVLILNKKYKLLFVERIFRNTNCTKKRYKVIPELTPPGTNNCDPNCINAENVCLLYKQTIGVILARNK